MHKFAGISAITIMAASTPVWAGEEVRYEKAPGWVQIAQVDISNGDDGPSEILFDWQHRLDGGVVQSYQDRAVRIDNLAALTSEGTLQMTWSPDKGDLFIHRLEILRGDEVLDLIADGVEFEVLRREQGLEQRLLDGQLTATVAVPGLQEGDVLRVAHSTTVDDQALGDEMQAFQYLPPEPFRVAKGRAIVSWPEGADTRFAAGPNVILPVPETRGGYNFLTIDLPIAKREDMPSDAPSRFRAPPILRVGSFASWQELSRVMEPHFTAAAQLSKDSMVANEAAFIMGEASDPLRRTELAVRLVQDQVSYLLNGLDGGNYLPQNAEETWEKRYGDCKAKSVLLHALLQQMGIDSNVVLVTTQGGDALPGLLPIPGNFDHMIVRATVDGVDYWLDGTSTATRMANMAEVPAFHYALPLTSAGADLTPMTDREQPYPDTNVEVVFDHSAGIDLPVLFEIKIEISGAQGAGVQAIVDEDDPEFRKQMTRNFGGGMTNAGQVTTIDLKYDDETAIGTVLVKGVADSEFSYDEGKFSTSLANVGEGVSFSPNRVRPNWREIPVATNGPSRTHMSMEIKLPGKGEGFTFRGIEDLDSSYANTRLVRKVSKSGAIIRIEEQEISRLGEIAVADLAASRQAALRISKADLELDAPANSVWRWERSKSELAKLTADALAAYNYAVEQADDDDFGPLKARARFNWLVYDFENAIEDYSAVIAEEPTASLFLDRASLNESLGRLGDAIADIQHAYDLSPQNSTAYYQAQLMARAGDTDGALALLDLLPVSEDEIDGMVDARSIVLGLAGSIDSGLELLAERLGDRTDNSTLLNADCWYRAIHKVALDDAVSLCNRAVERARSPAPVLDSRAMVHYRRGDMVSALVDLDAALKLSPAMSASRYLRGIILLDQGKSEGRRQVEMALRQSPELAEYYALYGIKPKS
ncbi:hypothetical protein GCM10023115_15010 [Pontixanthobacter gangjinensis]|uniref:DUF3857 domain-containing protein n=1 Tax=Pontixanthobacter gangjinensis TaxID=1028742 RepID=A0A6I4SNM0_9SPHN|nr:DUF3857 domain-containing protein [Pontixanthobacter gangjinensis]MXO56746.1 DUF3857 domain-containing protein [Pontixanthobacter gangjinensis]